MHNQKDNNKFKNKKQPELTENQTVRKPNNQGDKEETFIQTGRRGGDGQLCREESQQGSSRRTRAGKAIAGRPSEVVAGGAGSPTFAQINWEKQLGIQTDRATQGSNMGK